MVHRVHTRGIVYAFVATLSFTPVAAHAIPVDDARDTSRALPTLELARTDPALLAHADAKIRAQWVQVGLNVAAERLREQHSRAVEPRAVQRRPSQGAPLPSGSDAAFLACTRAHESDSAGGYQATDHGHGGTENMGAYQFDQRTWDGTARMAGRTDLVGVRPDQASPADQDQLAVTLYHHSGNGPWEGRC